MHTTNKFKSQPVPVAPGPFPLQNSPVGFCEKDLGRVEAWQMAG